MDETVKEQIRDLVIDAAVRVSPGVHLGQKYGGTVFMTDVDSPSTLVGGVFVYADHLSLEFSNGATFTDPDGRLEGKGKARRHLKLRALSDIDDKDVVGFLRQALP